MRLKRLGLPAPLAVALIAFATGACRSGGDGQAVPRRVVLLSLDGAAAQELWRLHQEGAFGPDGFERVLREGEVATRMRPVNPTLTAVNHISLASGFAPEATGIVSNTFHTVGDPISKRTDGFVAPIETELLWQAARRQGKRVGVIAWPGIGEAGSALAADWVLTWNSNTLRPSQILDIQPSDWRDAAGEAPAGLRSYSPPRRVGLELKEEKAFPAETLEVWALDRKDDGVVAYDAVAVKDVATEAFAVVGPGDWGRLVLGSPDAASPVGEWMLLRRLEPSGEASLYLSRAYRNDAYPAAYEHVLAERGALWPSPPDDDALKATWDGKPGLSLAAWCEQSDRFAEFFFDALMLGMQTQDWDLAIGYVPTIDEAAHQLLLEDPRQPRWSEERKRQFAAARLRVWQTADRQMARLLKAIDPRTTAVFVVSDHGLAPVHTAIDANAVLKTAGLLHLDAEGKVSEKETRAMAFMSGAVAHVYLNRAGREPGGVVSEDDVAATLGQVREIFASLRSGEETPIARILARDELGPLGMAHRNSGDLVLFAAPGYWFGASKPMASQALAPSPAYGQHGYPNDDPRMHAIFLAWGRGVDVARPDERKTPEVAGRVARSLGIAPPERSAPQP